YYQRLVAAYPRDERAHFLLGGAYFGQQDMPKAIQEYRRAVEVAPDFAPAYNLLGYAERQVGAYGEAERAFKKYIEKGDEARASELFQQVANQNTLPALNYSFVRAKAKKMKA
ncbi:MAG: tetratricopeptide repeat protein, partial [Gemmatimonadales bacterium]|nr:tetratricopeptide repeat protein [Gemmatimonadales bacterium]